MYYYYKQDKSHSTELNVDEGLGLITKHPAITFDRTEEMGIGPLMYIYLEVFTIIKRGFSRVYNEWHLTKNGRSCSKAVLISKVPIYQFMPDNGIHICFCRTNPEDRGKGYYPTLLKTIIKNNPEKDFYMIVDSSNISSIKGIEKAGFVRYAEGEKVGKTFKITRYVE